jgi:hypothetical protein
MRRVLATAIVLSSWCACAAPPPGTDLNSALHKWFDSQVVPQGDMRAGLSCCRESDGHIIEEDDWRISDGHYEIHIGDDWVVVRDTQVLSTQNPTGKPVAWYNRYPNAGAVVYCFAPGTVS